MSIFNQPIDPSLVKQLENRQNLLGKKDRNAVELSFLNSNTSWVKLQSSVNLLGTPTAAKNNVLFGGTLHYKPNSSRFDPRSGVATGDNQYNTYNAYTNYTPEGEQNVLGLRPMPGITSVNVENIGAYGSTRKATVNFQCWDVKQLEVLEALYMRPGYTVLLEFGRINYLDDTSSKLIDVDPRNNFFNDNIKNLHDYLSELYRTSIAKGGHYDVFFGYVVNFKWSARGDGGYDCMTEILSTGEVVESLKLNYSLGNAVAYRTLETDPLNASFKGLFLNKLTGVAASDIIRLNNEYAESVLSGLIWELYTACRYNHDSGSNSYHLSIPIPKASNKLGVDFALISYESTSDERKEDNPSRFLNNNDNYYVPLSSFCELVNAFIIPKAYNVGASTSKGNLTSISTNDRFYPASSNGEPLLCLYNSLVMSTNPDVCWVKNDELSNAISNTKVNIVTAPASTAQYNNLYVNESWSADLRNRINGWINSIFDKWSIGPSSNPKPINDLLQDINNTYNLLKQRSPSLLTTKKEYAKAIQANYQLVRGGIVGGKRNWDGLTSVTPNTKKNLSDYIEAPGDDITFWALLDRAYPSIYGLGPFSTLSSDSRAMATYIEGTFNDSNLDKQIDKNALAASKAVGAATTTATTATSLVNISDNIKNLKFKKDFKYDKKKNGGTSESDFGVIGNIYVNLKHLYLIAKSQSSHSSDPSGKNIISLGRYFDSLAQNIQTSLGNMNNFKIHIDPIDGIARIIDLNYINKDKDTSLFKFNIGTNDSLIRNMKLESYMSNDMMSMMSISAQAEAGKMGYDNTTVVTYNAGITDRLLPHKDILEPSTLGDALAYLNFISNIGMLVNTYLLKLFENLVPALDQSYNNVGASGAAIGSATITYENNPAYYAEQSNVYSNALREIINFITAYQNTDNADKLILPTEIALTIDGLAGFIIGNLFEVDNTFLPKYYKTDGRLGYTITGVSHEIANSDWTTTIKAFPVNLDSNTKKVDPLSNYATVYVTSNYGNTSGGSSDGSSNGLAVSSKDCGEPTVDIKPLMKRFGISYSAQPYLATPQFAADLENELFPAMAKLRFKYYATSAKRGKKLTKGGSVSDHYGGNAIDIQIIGFDGNRINSDSIKPGWKRNKTKYSGWSGFAADNGTYGVKSIVDATNVNNTHPYTLTQLKDIIEFYTAIVSFYPSTSRYADPRHQVDLTIAGGTYQFVNEHFRPFGSGPHFHFGRKCSNNKSTPLPSPKQPANTKKITLPQTTPKPIPPVPNPPSPAPSPAPAPKPAPAPAPPVPTPTPTVKILKAPPTKSTWTFPYLVEIKYTADGSRSNIVDEMHAFESTSGQTVGGGNTKIKAILDKMYADGIKPIVTDVSVITDHKANSVDVTWTITIEESKDGLAWTGFTSRGSASDQSLPTTSKASDPADKKDPQSIKNAIATSKQQGLGYMPSQFKEVANIIESNTKYPKYDNKGNKISNGRYFRQIFYVYTNKNP